MLVTRTAAQAVDIDPGRSATVAIVNGPVSADQEARVPAPAQDRVAPPDAFHWDRHHIPFFFGIVLNSQPHPAMQK